MRVRVLYFAVLRERLRSDGESVELAEGATVGALLDELAARHAAVAGLRRHLQVARNRETARGDALLADGDEVALIPPVAGGSSTAVRDAPLSVDEALGLVAGPGAGGIVLFVGVVRREGAAVKRVQRLEYEAYAAMAEERLRAIA